MLEGSPRERELQFGAGTYQKRDLEVVRGEGAYVFDASGKRYLDAIAGIGAAVLGHAHPKWTEAVARQAAAIACVPELLCSSVRAEFQRVFVESLPGSIRRCFLCNSGTEAIEGALKFARFATGRHGVIALKRGYHGKTMGALSATAEEKYREPFLPLLEGVRHVPAGNLETLEQALAEGPPVGAFVFEAVQGEGGIRVIDAEYLAAACSLARSAGALAIADEVQCGMGRTGLMWGFEAAGIEPDLVCAAKGIAGGVPMGAIGIGDRIPPLPSLSHTSTFGGNPLACAAALAVFKAIESEKLVANAASQGERIRNAIEGVSIAKIREVRGKGLMIGIELKEHAGPFLQPLAEAGLLVLLAGQRVIRLLPPLILREDQADAMAEILVHVLGDR